jgi:hypothetical protein
MTIIPQKKTLLELCGPTEFSSEGFLGTDKRQPEDIIKDDLAALQKLGATTEKIAAALREAYIKAERALGNPLSLTETITIVHEEARGRIPSPFPGDGTFQKGQAKISDAATGESLLITPLSIHLIEKHGFFQGRGSKYRIEPEAAVKIMIPIRVWQ